MPPIRVGIIGLSSVTTNVPPSPGDGWAASAHLPYLVTSPHYQVVALCNTSIQSARLAIRRHGLPPTTKAYANAQDLADDPDVDMVVCCVRVDRHYETIMPALEVGKNVFVEWPLGANLQQAEEMLATAQKSGSKTIVGLQGRISPVIQKVKQLVADKAIGDLLSSSLTYEVSAVGETIRQNGVFGNIKSVGGNLFTIMFGHSADPMLYALGGLKELSALLTTQWPKTKLLQDDGSFDRIVKRETPDHVLVQGVVGNKDAPISISVRGGTPFKDTPALTWRITGTKGELRITSVALISFAVGEKVELYDYEKDDVEIIDAHFADALKVLPPLAKNIGALYESFVTGGGKQQGFVDFQEAVGFHKILDKIEKSSEGRKYERLVL